MSDRRRTILVLLALSGLALGLRLYRLGQVPPGFHPDEAHNALDAWQIAHGWRPVFLPGNNGREPLFMYLMAGLMAVFGPSIWSARLAGAVAGVVMVPVQYLFVRQLPLPRPRRTALMGAALVAVSFWPVAQARYALRASLLPVWVALMLWAWWRAVATGGPPSACGGRQGAHGGRKAATQGGTGLAPLHSGVARPVRKLAAPRPVAVGRLGWGVLAGLFLAAAVYTHLTGRLLGLVMVVTVLAALAQWRASPLPLGQRAGGLARPVGVLLVALTVAAVLTLPLVRFFQAHPELVSYRADQVSVFNPAVNEGDLAGALAANAWRLLLMPFLHGDRSWYHNLSGRPVFEMWFALAMAVGLVCLGRDLAGRRGPRAQAAAVLLAVTLAVTLAPSWLSVGAPNYVRLTGVWPVLYLLPAWGLDRVVAWLETKQVPPYGGCWSGRWLVGAAFGLTLVLVGRDYFGRYAAAPQARAVFGASEVERGRQLAELGARSRTYVTPTLWQRSVIRFLNVTSPPAAVDLRRGLVWPTEGQAHYVFDPAEWAEAERFGARWPLFERQELRGADGQPLLLVFTTAVDQLPSAELPADQAVFGGHISLVGAAVEPLSVRPSGWLTVTLRWQALAPTEVDLNLFVHLVGPDGRSHGQFDGPPLGGSYPTTRWQPGEMIQEAVTVPVAAEVPQGPLKVQVGWYDWRSLRRLEGPGDEDAAVVGQVQVEWEG